MRESNLRQAMRKHRSKINNAADAYMKALAAKFPGLEQQPDTSDPPGGYDVWIQIGVPPPLHDQVTAVLDATTELNDRFWRLMGVNIVATVNETDHAAATRR
jgi:hypothetical protein